jgi:hypothetical protein
MTRLTDLQQRAVRALIDESYFPWTICKVTVGWLVPPETRKAARWYQGGANADNEHYELRDSTWDLLRAVIAERPCPHWDIVFQVAHWWGFRKMRVDEVLEICPAPERAVSADKVVPLFKQADDGGDAA